MSTAQVTAPSRPEFEDAHVETEQHGPPAVFAGDGETDLDVLKSIPKQFEVNDEKSANWLVRRIMDSRSYATQVKAWAEAELRRAAREQQTLLFLYGRQIEAWAKDEVAKSKGRRKSLNLPAGCVGFRASPPRIVVDDEIAVLTWARRSLPAAVVVTEKLAKSVINDHCERTGELPDDGVHIEPACEKFYIR